MIELFLELSEYLLIEKKIEKEKRGIQTLKDSDWEEEIETIYTMEKLNETNTNIDFTIKFD